MGNNRAGTEANARQARETGKNSRELIISHIDDLSSVPDLLSEAGYLSHQSGKWWADFYQLGGFTHGMTACFRKPRGRQGDVGLTIGRDGMELVFDPIDEPVEKKKPFFGWYAPFLPHTPTGHRRTCSRITKRWF